MPRSLGFWYFSTMTAKRTRAARSDNRRQAPALRHVDFHRTKYGPELAVDAGYIHDLKGFIDDDTPHVLRFYDITLITQGHGVYELDDYRMRVAPGAVFFTSPGQVRRWRVRELDGFCLFFSPDFVSEFFRDALFLYRLGYFHWPGRAPALRLTPAKSTALRRRLDRMAREVVKLRPDSVHVLRAMLYEVLLLLSRQFRGEQDLDAPPPFAGLVFRFLMAVEEHFRSVHRVADYAQELAVSPGYLNARVQQSLGRSAGAIVRERLIVEARRLLRYSDLSLAQIGSGLGFIDPSYFTRFVKRETGSIPSTLRGKPRVRF
jgi:AraC family transcriptional regulator, transcriptional activator of pobA